MGPSDGEIILTIGGIIVATLAWVNASYLRGRNALRSVNRLQGYSFGLGLIDANGQRSRIEHFLIQELRSKGASCVLAGRTQIQAEIMANDILDEMDSANPLFAIIGVVTEVCTEKDGAWRPHFDKWVRDTYPEAFTHNNVFSPNKLHLHYEGKTMHTLQREYKEQFPHLSPVEQVRTDKLLVRADCHCANGTVVSSYCLEFVVNGEQYLPAYEGLAGKIVEGLHIDHLAVDKAKASASKITFTREVMDGLVRIVKIVNNPGGSSEELDDLSQSQNRLKLHESDQPYQTKRLNS